MSGTPTITRKGKAVGVNNQLVTEADKKSIAQKIREVDDDSAKLAMIILDPKKSYHDKLTYIKNEIQESVREVEFSYEVDGFFEDSCYALHRAVASQQGFTKMKNNKSASSDNPPTMIDVRFASGKRIKVPYGVIFLPAFGKNAKIEMHYDAVKKRLMLSGICQRKYTVLMDEIIEDTQHILNTDSIYRNQAIKYDGVKTPTFMDLSTVENIELFLTEQAKYATVPIEVRIESPEICKNNGLDLKFGVLLEGNYGTGKTLYASKLAAKAIKNNWTFIYCSKPENTLEALKVANKFTKNGAGVVLFIEDVDQILNKRKDMTNEISLLMDGSETKNNNLISIFSTNHIENIDPTFLRGKRIGSIVTLEHLDAMTAEKMLTFSLKDHMSESCSEAAKKIEEYKIVPAFVSEIIDRVKTHTILKDDKEVKEKDILLAIEQFKRQMNISTVVVDKKTDEQKLIELQNKLQINVIKETLEENPVIEGMRELLNDQGYGVKDKKSN